MHLHGVKISRLRLQSKAIISHSGISILMNVFITCKIMCNAITSICALNFDRMGCMYVNETLNNSKCLTLLYYSVVFRQTRMN